jgi:hypothetical protein
MSEPLRAVRTLISGAAIALVAGAITFAPVAAEMRGEASPKIDALEVRAKPIEAFDLRDPARVRFGSLEFRSGLVLTSSYRGFGGLSALRLNAKGDSFIALSDKGDWFTGNIVYDGKAMAGLANVKSAPMLGDDGRSIQSRGWFDSESLAVDDTTLYVGLERVNRILKFDFSQGGITSRGREIAVPPAVARLPYNKGLEALAFVSKDSPLAGTLIAISERGLDRAGNILGFMIGGPQPGQFTVRRTDDFDISDCVLLPSGDMLLLERKFSLAAGVGIRIRRIALDTLKPGAVVDGPAVFDADLGYEIDNMEGIDVHRDADGDLVLTMISDDNFSMLQRTLLLQFKIIQP